MTDQLQKFLFQHAPVRGEFVELTDVWRQIQSHHTYPLPVIRLLGEMIAAAVLLSGNIKFGGSLIMQVQGDGPVRLLVVECDASLNIRATAKLEPDAVIQDTDSFRSLIHAHGKGRFVITLDPQDKAPGQQPYQGIVSLEGDSLAELIENYMKQSEQLDTRLWLAADTQVIRGLLLQRMPQSAETGEPDEKGNQLEDAWQHIVTLASTLKPDEMLVTGIDTLRHRLFWEEDLLVFDSRPLDFRCTCSREKVGNMLKMLGQEEVEQALREQGALEINCDFCGQTYRFDAVDSGALFADAKTDSPEKPSLH